MPYSVSLIRKMDVLQPELRGIFWDILEEIERDREATVTKTDFNDLKGFVTELTQKTAQSAEAQQLTTLHLESLAEAQKRTEERLESLIQHVENLAEAQKRTEERLESLAEAQKHTEERLESLIQRVESLAEAQKRTEERLESLAEAQKRTEERLESLTKRVESLAEAQKRTEERLESLTQRVENLTEAQKRTEERLESLTQRVESLAEAQKVTEKEVAKLAREMNIVRSQIGGLSKSVAYALENEAFRKLPLYLKTHCRIEVKERFIRTLTDGKEINIFAKASRDGSDVFVVGEAVMKLDDYKKMKQLNDNVKLISEKFDQPVIPLVITHFAHPNILEKARNKGVIVVQSFEWDY